MIIRVVTPEKMPYYDRSTDRSIYHIREYAVRELSLVCTSPAAPRCRLTLKALASPASVSVA